MSAIVTLIETKEMLEVDNRSTKENGGFESKAQKRFFPFSILIVN